MVRLSDSQAVVLGAACQRADRSVYPLTTKLPGAAATKVLGSLVKKGFIEELQAKPQDTVWREDKKKGRLTLRATPAAFDALGIDPPSGAETVTDTDAVGSTSRKAKKGKSKEKAAPATRANSKQAQLIEMLKSRNGATIEEIVKKFEWQAHTVRGAMAGALKKKLGLKVESEKVEGRGRVYRIAS